MAEYLSKEEIKQWRSSLEKITLEEYAARLGKVVADSRPTNDLIDIIYSGESVSNKTTSETNSKLSKIAERAFERERQLSHTPFSFKAPTGDNAPKREVKPAPVAKKAAPKPEPVQKKIEKPIIQEKAPAPIIKEDALREEVNIVLKKNLTDREQVVFDYLLEHKNTTVYAKDIATLLDLPRDYIYKYIKNLRAKIDGDKLKNADRGGFILSV